MIDPQKVLDDLKTSADWLKEAADRLRAAGGNSILDQALMAALKAIIRPKLLKPEQQQPLVTNVADALKEKFGEKKDQQPTGLRGILADMARSLAQPKYERSGTSNPTAFRPTSTVFRKLASIGLRKSKTLFAGTRFGRMVGKVGRTRVGRAVGGMAARAAGTVAARAGVTAGSGAAAGAGATAAGASAATGVGIVLAALILVGTALYVFGKRVVDASDKQLEAMRNYEKVSASMALVFAQADLRETLRNMERGEKLAPSAQLLSNADQKLKDNSTEIIVLLESIKNTFLGLMESGLAELIGPLNEMAAGVNGWLKRNGIVGDEQKFEAFDQFLDRVAKDTVKAMAAGDRWHQAARADRNGR